MIYQNIDIHAPDDEVVEVQKPKADVEPPKKRAAKTAKAPTKETVVVEDDSDDEPVIIKKAKGPARKAMTASKKAPESTKIKLVSPAPGTFIAHDKNVYCTSSDFVIVLLLVEQTMTPAHRRNLQHQSLRCKHPRHARLQHLQSQFLQSRSRSLLLHSLSLVSSY